MHGRRCCRASVIVLLGTPVLAVWLIRACDERARVASALALAALTPAWNQAASCAGWLGHPLAQRRHDYPKEAA